MRTLYATIVDGETDWADFFFLVALLAFFLALVASLARQLTPVMWPAVCLGLTCIAGAWLLL